MMLTIRPRLDVSDGVSWWCRNCQTRKSIRAGSFFGKARQYPMTDAYQEAQVDKGTALDIYRWLREICSFKFL